MAIPEELFSKEKIKKIAELDFENDVLIIGFPRTGTTWLQELIWIIQHDGDLDQASKVQVGCRVPFLESRGYDWEHCVYDLDQHPHPRVMKSHLTADFFQSKLDKLKLIVSIRNPKDTIVSMYNYFKMWKSLPFEMTMENLIEVFVGNRPFASNSEDFNYFSWYLKVVPILGHENVMLVKYEDQKKDLNNKIREIADFLGKHLDETIIDAIVEHCSFKKLKENAMVNQTGHEIYDQTKGNFFHKGQVGTWKELLTEEQSKLIDDKYEMTLKKAGMELEFD
ncbi:hypothetical protein LSH36_362g04003 [Paralvinella palmiformis]|uniref:Sulfotransferase domain-containing protein n=1 Tax=Paralvinella palmiformis TaxID=53620 RepID=A0AAD9JEY7_9ANNE|nr:hypothetical protein LSH36_362g04003 [Paralvinella palmiformis]